MSGNSPDQPAQPSPAQHIFWRFNVGHLLTIIAFFASLLGVGFQMNGAFTVLQEKVKSHDTQLDKIAGAIAASRIDQARWERLHTTRLEQMSQDVAYVRGQLSGVLPTRRGEFPPVERELIHP